METRASQTYEARLVERFRQGDANALSALFELHVDRVYAYAYHILGCREDAEEIVSEAFLRAFRHATDYRGESAFRGWVFGITRNLCRDRLRQPRLIQLPEEPEERAQADDTDRLALRTDVREAMSHLSEEYREILLLCDVEEWDAHEAAVLMGRSLTATKSLLYRARKALRGKLAELWEEGQ